MQTYTFDELSERAQCIAYAKYSHSIMESDINCNTFDDVKKHLNALRFTEHGERIA